MTPVFCIAGTEGRCWPFVNWSYGISPCY